ncbi:hypothetical protein LCI18_006752 [Fusarium solani-melongenae]|uniref:Uncharacterized protein n=1 Tax=Fusarium solani subsp. cucurbitae TaxID=2747967 RepID=A0ACD3Z3P8_FUSSC|nr:hypothetical protein LCI18_006752 [Fusarium solani-melongenae]
MNNTQQSLKRQRSLTSEDLNPPTKLLKQEPAPNDSGLKRPRSPSSADGGPPAERPRLSAESTLVEPEDKDEEPLEIGGLQVYNIRQALVGAHGEEFPLPASNTEKQDNLPTPSTVLGQKSPLAKSPTASVAFVGDTKLLRFIPAKIYIFQSATTTKALHSQPYTEIIRVTGAEKLSLGTFVPTLAGSGWDIIQLVDPKLGFVETTNGLLDERGLFFETDLVFTGALQPVSNFLREFFRQKEPGIRFSAWLGRERAFDRIESLETLMLRGTLRDVSVNIFDILEFREIGVELLGSRLYDTQTEKMKWHFGFGFFGHLHVTMPRSVVPLQVDYKLRKILSVWELELCLKNEDWMNVMGIEGLALSEVMLISRLDGSDPKSSKLSFDVTAVMQLRSATMQDVGEIFYELTKVHLDVFDYDVTFDAMSLTISSTELALCGAVTINGHTSVRGSLIISKDGIEVRGAIGDIAFDDWDLLIREAGFDVFIASKMKGESARSTKLSISGDVGFHGIDARVALFTEKHPKLGWVWTVYGEVSGDLSTSRLVPALKGNSMLDISLNRLAIIASSRDAAAGTLQGVPFNIVKGVQLCASIDSIAAIEALLGGSVKGMVLRAAYTNGAFALGISLPAARTIRFSDDIWTGPIELSILAGPGVPSPKLMIGAVLNFQVDGQPDDMPLQLELTLGADLIGATASAKMLTPWVNPFGTGKNVVIKTCVMEIGIIYTTFIASGTPGSLAFGGQLAIGSKTAGATFKFSQNPKEQLVDIFVENLGVSDLITFASLVADRNLPTVADDLLHFTKLNMYFSTGTTIGKDVYPPGISAKGDLKIFGKRAQFDCTLGKAVKIMATIEQFSLGPLTVRGATKPDPLVDIEFSAQAQKILIDGAVDIWGASAALHLDVGLLPKTTFDFFVYLKLSDLFLLKLEAQLKGTIDIKNYKTWANADFAMYGLMEQRVIDYVTAQLDQQISAAHEGAKKGFEKVKQDMEAKEAVFKAGCDDAIKKLEIAKAVWLAKKAQVDSDFANASASATAERKRLQAKVDETERDFKNLIRQKQNELEQIRSNANNAIRVAQAAVDLKQRDLDDGVRVAQAGVQVARADFLRRAEIVTNDIKNKQAEVDQAKREKEQLKDAIWRLERQRDAAEWLDKWEYRGRIATAEGLLFTVDQGLKLYEKYLEEAKGARLASEYIQSEGAVRAAELALQTARQALTPGLNLAKQSFTKVNTTQQALIQGAIEGLRFAETASDELKLFELAKRGLAEGERVTQALLNTAQKAVDELSSCVEFVGFETAKKGVQFAKENTKELNLARHAVETAEDAVELELDLAKWATDHAKTTFNIRKVEFSGSVRSLVHPDEGGPPLRVKIEGTILGEEINWEIVWKPKFDLVKFIKELFTLLWEKIKELAKEIV